MKSTLSVHAAIALAFALAPAAFDSAAAMGARENVLYSFAGGNDGAFPQSNVIMDSQRNFYGTTENGGGSGCGGGACGTVFKLTRGGKEKLLHVFTGGTDGAFPIASLVMDDAGNLYGTALKGGAECQCGVVYKITPNGTESVVYAFKGGEDGSSPLGALASDHQGNFFGTTSKGGIDCNGSGEGCGTVFKIKPTGRHKVMYAFKGGHDGIYPAAGLTFGIDGIFYGTTANGGIDCDGTGQGCGIVFAIAQRGTEHRLYSFTGGDHGAYPAGGVVQDHALNLFGTTNNGGVDCDGSGAGCGTVFALAPDGTETGLHVFAGGNDGQNPRAAPLLDDAGNLYGTTAAGGGGGENSDGVVFRLSSGGNEMILYAFAGGSDGGGPFSGLTADAQGNLYGTTFTGGDDSDGTVFKLRMR
jgi:uncharacterized repeat protein (TIGR03803 family)